MVYSVPHHNLGLNNCFPFSMSLHTCFRLSICAVTALSKQIFLDHLSIIVCSGRCSLFADDLKLLYRDNFHDNFQSDLDSTERTRQPKTVLIFIQTKLNSFQTIALFSTFILTGQKYALLIISKTWVFISRLLCLGITMFLRNLVKPQSVFII